MFFIVFIILTFIGGLNIHLFGYKSDKEKIFRNWVGFLYARVLGISTQISFTSDIDTTNKPFLIISNHSSLLDWCGLMLLHEYLFPNHDWIIVAKENIRDVPLIGSYFEKNHIMLKRDIHKDKEVLQQYKEKFRKKSKPFVIYLFPEGTTFCRETLNKSIEKLGTRRIHWKNLLYPKSGALKELYDIVDGNILDLTLIYKGFGKDQYMYDLLRGNYHKHAHFFLKECCAFSDDNDGTIQFFKKKMEGLWDEKDTFIESINNPEEKKEIHFNLFSSGFLFVNTPLALVMFGFKKTFFLLFLIQTSIEYHLWGRHRNIDMLCAVFNIIYFFNLYRFWTSKMFLLIGIIVYLIQSVLISTKHIPFHGRMATFLHSYMHAVCYFSIVVEWLENMKK